MIRESILLLSTRRDADNRIVLALKAQPDGRGGLALTQHHGLVVLAALYVPQADIAGLIEHLRAMNDEWAEWQREEEAAG
jgi:hypothetical protein